MENNKVAISMEQQFGEVIDIILQHKGRASRAVNNELLFTAWYVGGYVSAKLKSEEWGSKVVTQLSEYIRSQRPDIKGYSRRSIYNPQIQISAESETKRSIFRKRDKTKRSKKESAQHSKSRNKSFVMTSVSAL